jgi:hypothetical protein
MTGSTNAVGITFTANDGQTATPVDQGRLEPLPAVGGRPARCDVPPPTPSWPVFNLMRFEMANWSKLIESPDRQPFRISVGLLTSRVMMSQNGDVLACKPRESRFN